MIFQSITYTFDLGLGSVITVFILLAFLVIMIWIYAKFRRWILALVFELGTVILGLASFGVQGMPLGIWIPSIIIIINTLIFLFITMEAFQYGKD